MADKMVQKIMKKGEQMAPVKSIKIKFQKAKRTAKRLSSTKAKQILKDNSAQGHPLTGKQKKFFGAIAGGAKPFKTRSPKDTLLRGMRGYKH